MNSVAVVPVGLTKYRQGLYPLEIYRQDTAGAVIDQVEAFAQQRLEAQGTRLVWCSDEFYLLAGRELPEKSYYEDMDQLENGVGMLRLLTSQAETALEDAQDFTRATPFSIATGTSAAPFLQKIVDMAREKCDQIQGTVYPIANRFFGEEITVAGLVTGGDLIAQLRGKNLGQRLLIPDCMLRAGERVFLDDVSVDDVERELGVPVSVLDHESGFDLADAILGLETASAPRPPAWENEEFYRYNP